VYGSLRCSIISPSISWSRVKLERDSAPGIDGVTWQAYGENLEEKLKDLHDHVHRGSYRARPARRTYIPKADGSKRPLSILCLEDKIVQQAVATVLAAIYEEDFPGFSYGFRPGRGQHDALDALHAGILRKQVNWVLDADIRGFFDTMAHPWIIRFLEHRIADKRILRLIVKWLKVGTVEDGRRTRGVCGAPQGAVISPILANAYLHYVFDLWVHRWRLTKASGDMIVIRYADDSIVGFQHEHEAMSAASRCSASVRRQGELKRSTVCYICDGPQASAVGFDDRTADRQPHTHTAGFGSEERVE
jgi:RNA-directed DNA polymerase